MKVRDELAEEGIKVSLRWLCSILDVPRSQLYRPAGSRKRTAGYSISQDLAVRIRSVIDKYPFFGLRRIHWQVNQDGGPKVNRKAVHRVLKRKGWTMHSRPKGMRPRAKGWASRCEKPNQRWAVDTTHFSTKEDGWCHVTAIIDCCDRQIVGWRVSSSGKAYVAAAALEDAIIRRSPPTGLSL